MVSELYVASASGDLDKVSALLEGGNVDLEIKDHEGVNPLIVAAKNGHLKVVEKLLEKGADPLNPGAHGPPESYATDSLIIDTLRAAAMNKASQAAQAAEANGYMHHPNQAPNGYYMPPPGAYYYPPPPEGMQFYPPPHHHQQPNGDMQGPHSGHNSNLPPPEIARLIPCRYFPACRYGASCMFAHPGPYGMPPPPSHGAPYPGPYENGGPGPYQPNFYPMPPPNYAPNGMPMSPQSPPQMMHQRSASDMLSPVQAGFPGGMPGPMPYGPTSPVAQPPYSNGQGVPPMSLPPMAAPGPQSPPQAYPQSAVPQSAQAPYEQPLEISSPPASAPVQQTTYGQVPAQKTSPPLANGDAPQLNGHRVDGFGHHRRGSGFRRGPSFGSRKPPCAFFPSGRCRNGDDCRFPHVTPDAAPTPVHHAPPPFMGRGGRFRGPPMHHVHANSVNGVNGVNGVHTNGNGPANGVGGLEDGFANLNVRDEPQRGRGSDRTTSSASSSQARAGAGKPGLPLNGVNGARPNGKPVNLPKQRVPNADEFPVLAGTTTPPARSPLGAPAGLGGPTAAQVLQNPAPSRKDLVKDLFRGGAPKTSPPIEAASTVNPTPTTTTTPAPAPVAVTPKLPISFAAIATGAPEVSKEVSVAA